ncbi:MAG: hypothetical protein N4J56_006935 [Chroococcidiopsis sp. SAG 2025]|nr:hypothetical protein [Chroococcidiopsis sp. SAG 2025]
MQWSYPTRQTELQMSRLQTTVRAQSAMAAAAEEQQGLIDRLLLERISLAGIARVLQLSEGV